LNKRSYLAGATGASAGIAILEHAPGTTTPKAKVSIPGAASISHLMLQDGDQGSQFLFGVLVNEENLEPSVFKIQLDGELYIA